MMFNFFEKLLKKKNKRAVSQIDWVMSLALFLLYIAWFFVFILPNLNYQKNFNPNIAVLENFFFDEFSYTIKKIPIFIFTNSTKENKPVIIFLENNFLKDNLFENDLEKDFYYSSLKSEKPFVFYDNNFFFLLNESEKNTFLYLYQNMDFENNNNYNIFSSDLNSNQDVVTIDNMNVYFDNALPNRVFYKDSEKIKSISFKINGIDFSMINFTNNIDKFLSIHNSIGENINISTIIFTDNQEIYLFFKTPNKEKYTLKISFDLNTYDSYYSDNLNFGNFSYSNNSEEISFSSNFVVLYNKNNNEKIVFYFESSNFEFENYNNTLNLNIEADINNSYFKIAFISDELNFEDIVKQDYSYDFSIFEIENIILLNKSQDYEYYKNKTGFDFSLFIYDQNNTYFEIGNKTIRKNVYSIEKPYLALKDNSIKPVMVNFRLW